MPDPTRFFGLVPLPCIIELDYLACFQTIYGLPASLREDLELHEENGHLWIKFPEGRMRGARVSTDGNILIHFGYSYNVVLPVEHAYSICDHRFATIWKRADT